MCSSKRARSASRKREPFLIARNAGIYGRSCTPISWLTGGGAKLAAEVGAISADHLEFASDDGLKAMAHAGVVGRALAARLALSPAAAARCPALHRGGRAGRRRHRFQSRQCAELSFAARHDARLHDEPSNAGAVRSRGRRSRRPRRSARTRKSVLWSPASGPILCCSTPKRSSIGCITSDPTRSTRSMSAETAFSPLPALRERGRG